MISEPAPAPGTSTYRERLVPGPAGVAAVVLFALMCGLVVLVSRTVAAAITSLTALVVGLVLVAVTSPVVEVRGRSALVEHRLGHVGTQRDEGREVEADQALVLEGVGDVARDDALREPLDDCSLANARLTDENRIVLRTSR